MPRLPRGLRRSTKVILTLSVVMCLCLVLIGAKKTPIPEDLGDKYKTWLEAVELIITKEERDAFLAIKKDYQRDAFIEQFWKIRDQYPATARNEFRERYEAMIEQARHEFGDLTGDRSKIMLLNGLPEARIIIACHELWPAEVWFYSSAQNTGFETLLLFYRRFDQGPYWLWYPQDSIRALLKFAPPRAIGIQELVSSCRYDQGQAVAAAIGRATSGGALSFMSTVSDLLRTPKAPSKEWVTTFHTYSTDLAPTDATFNAEVAISFPGRHQNRTIVQSIITVPVDQAGLADLAGHTSYNFVVTGEVLREDRLFDNFRYQFNFSSSDIPGDQIPLVFERYLRPAKYDLVIKVEDLNAKAYFRNQAKIEVPVVDYADVVPPDKETAKLLAEANAAISTGAATLRIVPPRGELNTGMTRIETLITGSDIGRVSFILDGRPLLTKVAPPFSVELDLGSLPRIRTLEAVAYNSADEELARDEIQINTGANRFAVRLVEPRRNKRYVSSLRAEAKIDIPEDKVISKVDYYLNETLVATLNQPPWVQPILLNGTEELAYVRVVASLPDGNTTEDTVFINAPPHMENLEIQFVELYITALDENKRPVKGLGIDDFLIFEDGLAQDPMRFDLVSNLPIHAEILLDVSASMEESLSMAQQAALGFFEASITPKDRAALITFNDHPNLTQKFTNDLGKLAGGLAGLRAERGTALYDSLIFALYYFNGIKGQRALVLLSDGQDEHSRFSYEDTLEYARRAGVAIYTIGLNLSRKERDVRKKLSRLAQETGGRSFIVESSDELPVIYEIIQDELRSRYYLAYQSSNSSEDDEFRTIEIKIAQSGVEAKTMRGYYP